jgi:hypothetical protein
VAGRKIEAVEGELVEITARRQERKAQGQAQSLEALVELGKMRGYKNPAYWARAVLHGRGMKQRRRA